MSDAEDDVRFLMRSVMRRYFPELEGQVSFSVKKDASIDGIRGQARSGKTLEITLYYREDRILELNYRMWLVPVISHELAHFISPVDPEEVMRKRLPASMMQVWQAYLDEGYASCSMKPG